MEKPNVDVAVLLLFFTRTAHTVYTFEQIRKAKPARLYLYQDGPRPGREDDIKNVKECREAIESMIDWECEVHRKYQEQNYGCDPSEYLSQKWMFETETKGIIIEDDDVMSVSFFPFCKELLDRYENDTRINMICGQNHLGTYDAGGADYLFTRTGGIWGWATWKRTIDTWDTEYKFMKDKYTMDCLEHYYGKRFMRNFVKTCKFHLSKGKEYYESLRNANQFVNHQLNIVPAVNMTCNIGTGVETTHSNAKAVQIPRAARKNVFAPLYEVAFPLRHPDNVVEDMNYFDKKMALRGNWLVRTLQLRSIECRLYHIFPFLGRIGSKEFLDRVEKYNIGC